MKSPKGDIVDDTHKNTFMTSVPARKEASNFQITDVKTEDELRVSGLGRHQDTKLASLRKKYTRKHKDNKIKHISVGRHPVKDISLQKPFDTPSEPGEL